MSDVLDAVGLISEVLTWVALGPGLLLLLAGGTARWAGARWCSADGVAFVDGARRGVRWFDDKHGFLEGVVRAGDGAGPAAGTDVLVYYDARNPARWQVDEPQPPGHTLLLLGKILTGVGVLAAAAGLVVMAF
ncbi:sortase [Arthrobacter sp. GCM10027362]|uniref:sortase n=1 Tax=Arthrobacter sp. GCM10027362 TaxID=3273379 RepID=UPI00363F223F